MYDGRLLLLSIMRMFVLLTATFFHFCQCFIIRLLPSLFNISPLSHGQKNLPHVLLLSYLCPKEVSQVVGSLGNAWLSVTRTRMWAPKWEGRVNRVDLVVFPSRTAQNLPQFPRNEISMHWEQRRSWPTSTVKGSIIIYTNSQFFLGL